MVEKKSADFSQRRITLQIFLQSNAYVSLDQIQKLPVYRRLQLPQKDLVNRICEDLKVLRESGIDIIKETRKGIKYYRIDSSDEIPLNFENGFDATLLRTILQHHSDIEQVLYAKSGVNKLLSEAKADNSQSADLPVVANLPKGAFIAQIAKAVVAHKGLVLDYYSLNSQERRTYKIIPQALIPHFESFYLRGYKIKEFETDSIQLESKPRIFNTSRILSEPISFSLPQSFSLTNRFSTGQKPDTPFSASLHSKNPNRSQTGTESKEEKDPENNASDYFAKVKAIVKIKNGFAKPLSEIAVRLNTENFRHLASAEIQESELQDRDIYLIPSMYREDLFELLCFYGVDVELIAPKELRQEFQNRLQHIENLVSHLFPPDQHAGAENKEKC